MLDGEDENPQISQYQKTGFIMWKLEKTDIIAQEFSEKNKLFSSKKKTFDFQKKIISSTPKVIAASNEEETCSVRPVPSCCRTGRHLARKLNQQIGIEWENYPSEMFGEKVFFNLDTKKNKFGHQVLCGGIFLKK